jgi:hypothetical protein
VNRNEISFNRFVFMREKARRFAPLAIMEFVLNAEQRLKRDVLIKGQVSYNVPLKVHEETQTTKDAAETQDNRCSGTKRMETLSLASEMLSAFDWMDCLPLASPGRVRKGTGNPETS